MRMKLFGLRLLVMAVAVAAIASPAGNAPSANAGIRPPLAALDAHFSPSTSAVTAVPALTHVGDIVEYGSLVGLIVNLMTTVLQPEPK